MEGNTLRKGRLKDESGYINREAFIHIVDFLK